MNPRYLSPATLGRARERFLAHPGHLLTLPQFLDDRVARRLARFLGGEARFRAIYSLRRGGGSLTARAEWLAAPNPERLYRLREYAGPRRAFRGSPNALTFGRLVTALADRRFVGLFEALTGVPLDRCELRVHGLGVRDMLRPHADRWGARRLTFVLYLTPGWRAEFGGLFTLLGPSRLRTEVPPAFNSLVLFDIACDTQHFVTPITPAAGPRVRVTVGGWIDAGNAEN